MQLLVRSQCGNIFNRRVSHLQYINMQYGSYIAMKDNRCDARDRCLNWTALVIDSSITTCRIITKYIVSGCVLKNTQCWSGNYQAKYIYTQYMRTKGTQIAHHDLIPKQHVYPMCPRRVQMTSDSKMPKPAWPVIIWQTRLSDMDCS